MRMKNKVYTEGKEEEKKKQGRKKFKVNKRKICMK